MAEKPSDPPSASDGSDFDFRWTAFFQRGTDPLFVLNRRRQILFVNCAWETLTGIKGRDVLKRVCKRRRDAESGSCEAVLNALAPPREVMAGQSARVRRLFAQRDMEPQWWDIEFLPLRGPLGLLGLVGKVVAVPTAETATSQPLPEKLMALRQRLTDWWGAAPYLDRIAGHAPCSRASSPGEPDHRRSAAGWRTGHWQGVVGPHHSPGRPASRKAIRRPGLPPSSHASFSVGTVRLAGVRATAGSDAVLEGTAIVAA